MAFIVDHGQQSNNYKHFCKICKKGFMCGRALGGHMRAHGIGDDLAHMDDDDDDPPSDWEDNKFEPNNNNNNDNNKRMYALRTNPNRLKNYSNCEHCGKEFSSWKSYFEHGRCTASDDAESLVSSPSPGSDDEPEYEDDVEPRKPGWSKRKRSTRAKIDNHDHDHHIINNNNSNNNNNLYRPSSEEEDLAHCLMMLSSATIDRSTLATEPEESCASASKDEEFQRQNLMINFVTSAPPNNNNIAYHHRVLDKAKGIATTTTSHNNNKNGMFECKACKKVFNSHQALGGHRASHKKVKGCFASRLDNNLDIDNNNNNLVRGDQDDVTAQAHEDQFFIHSKTLSSLTYDHGTNVASSKRTKSKVHECSICHRIFSSGQALGGHKRCHWITSNSADPSSLAKQFQQFHHQIEQIQHNNNINESDQPLNLNLNLNLPAPNANRFQVPADVYLQSWLRANNEEGKNDTNKNNNNVSNNNNNNNVNSVGYVDDEADSKVKLAKLSDLKDMNVNGNSSPWLQVGIGATSERVGSDP